MTFHRSSHDLPMAGYDRCAQRSLTLLGRNSLISVVRQTIKSVSRSSSPTPCSNSRLSVRRSLPCTIAPKLYPQRAARRFPSAILPHSREGMLSKLYVQSLSSTACIWALTSSPFSVLAFAVPEVGYSTGTAARCTSSVRLFPWIFLVCACLTDIRLRQ